MYAGTCCCNADLSKVGCFGFAWFNVCGKAVLCQGFGNKSQVMRVYSVFGSFAVLKLWMCVCVCVCVCGAWTQVVCIHNLTFRLHHTRHRCSVFTALWCACSFVKLNYLHQIPSWLWLVWINKPMQSSQRRLDMLMDLHGTQCHIRCRVNYNLLEHHTRIADSWDETEVAEEKYDRGGASVTGYEEIFFYYA